MKPNPVPTTMWPSASQLAQAAAKILLRKYQRLGKKQQGRLGMLRFRLQLPLSEIIDPDHELGVTAKMLETSDVEVTAHTINIKDNSFSCVVLGSIKIGDACIAVKAECHDHPSDPGFGWFSFHGKLQPLGK